MREALFDPTVSMTFLLPHIAAMGKPLAMAFAKVEVWRNEGPLSSSEGASEPHSSALQCALSRHGHDDGLQRLRPLN